MKFFFRAVQQDGRVTEGIIEALTDTEALAQITRKGLRPLTLKPERRLGGIKRFFAGHKITTEDKVFITKYLSLMLKVGTDLFKAIDILIEDFDKPAVRALLQEIRENLEKGQPFFTVFARYPKTFSPVFISLIKAGEISGNLEGVFEQLSQSLEVQRELNSKIKASLTYPVILLIMSVLIFLLLVSFSIPKIANVFLSGGVQPPPFSRIVFSVGLFAGKNIWWILILLVGGAVGMVVFFTKNALGKHIAYESALRLPVIRRVIREISLQRFASTLASLLGSGIPIIEALEISASSTGMPELKNALQRIAREGILKGLTVGEAFKREPVFPKVVSNLVAVSEKSGHLEEILGTLSKFYSSEIESSVKSLVSFIEPIMLVLIGVIIGAIALAVIVPVYQLTSTF